MAVVIVGSGLGGYTVAREFRKHDSDSQLVVVSADHGGFYSKPMLSNALARGQQADDLVTADAEKMGQDLNATIKARHRVTSIDRAAGKLHLEDQSIPYDRLVLAVGAHPIEAPLAGDGVGDVLSVNNVDQYRVFRERIAGRRHIAVLGPGLIGSEFANDLVAAGYRVTVIGPDHHPLGRLVPQAVGRAVQQSLADLGVEWRLETLATRVDVDGDGYRIELDDASVIEADVVLSAIGLRPDVQLARDAGLAVNRGIVVDRHLQTDDANIFAIGDCAEVNGRVLPFVMPIMHGARALARSLAGEPTAVEYPPMPVVVKTPACPVVVAPPPHEQAGDWRIDQDGDGVSARFEAPGGALLGFALAGSATGRRQALTRELPALLD